VTCLAVNLELLDACHFVRCWGVLLPTTMDFAFEESSGSRKLSGSSVDGFGGVFVVFSN
jgi:hypothetical protein